MTPLRAEFINYDPNIFEASDGILTMRNTHLSGIVVKDSAGNEIVLNPFVKTLMEYTATVGYEVDSITITPTAESALGEITVNETPVVSGEASVSILLPIGVTNIPVVLKVGGFTLNYSIAIDRVDTSLSNLVFKGYPGTDVLVLSPAPGFLPSVFSYTSITGKEKVTVKPTTPVGVNSVIKVYGNIVNSGSTSIPIVLDVSTTTIHVTVTIGTITTTYTVFIN